MLLTELSMLQKMFHVVNQHWNIYLFQNEQFFGILLSGKQYAVEFKSLVSECKLPEFKSHICH